MQKLTKSFNEMLFEELNKTNEKTNVNKCLISDEPLNDTQIKLACNHIFNYKPLFNEILIQKTRYNNLETQRLRNYQIKCPYCRNTQDGILPYRKNYQKIKYVNWPEKLAIKQYKCKYIFLSGKRKGCICAKDSSREYCIQHFKIIEKRNEKEKQKKEQIENIILQHAVNTLENDPLFIKQKEICKTIDFSNVPALHHTKTYSYFRCRCQHVVNKGKTNEKMCGNYMVCSSKLGKHGNTTPVYYKKYLCKRHNYKDPEKIQNNIIKYPNEINLDLTKIPKFYILNHTNFNAYLNKFYFSFSCPGYKYNYLKYKGFQKKGSENTKILNSNEKVNNSIITI